MKKCIIRFTIFGSNVESFYTEDGRSAKVFDSLKEAKYVMWQLKCCEHKNVHCLFVK